MNHRDIRELLADFALGRLEGGQRDRIQEHLAGCSRCREWLATYELLGRALEARQAADHPRGELAEWAVLDGELPEAASRHLAECPSCRSELERLREAISAARETRPREPAVRWASAAAVAVLLLAGSLLLFTRQPTATDQIIRGGVLTGEQTFTGRSIVASDVELQPGSRIVFEAGKMVALGDGFVVGSRVTFEAATDDRPGGSGKPEREAPGS